MNATICKVIIKKGSVLPVLDIEWKINKSKKTPVDYLVQSELDFTIIREQGRISQLDVREYSFLPRPNGEIKIEIPFGDYSQRISFSQHSNSYISERLLYANIYLRSGEFGEYNFMFHSGGIFDKKRGLVLSSGYPSVQEILILNKAISDKHFHRDFFYLKPSDNKKIFDGVYVGNKEGQLIYSDDIDEFNTLFDA